MTAFWSSAPVTGSPAVQRNNNEPFLWNLNAPRLHSNAALTIYGNLTQFRCRSCKHEKNGLRKFPSTPSCSCILCTKTWNERGKVNCLKKIKTRWNTSQNKWKLVPWPKGKRGQNADPLGANLCVIRSRISASASFASSSRVADQRTKQWRWNWGNLTGTG